MLGNLGTDQIRNFSIEPDPNRSDGKVRLTEPKLTEPNPALAFEIGKFKIGKFKKYLKNIIVRRARLKLAN